MNFFANAFLILPAAIIFYKESTGIAGIAFSKHVCWMQVKWLPRPYVSGKTAP